ncbi:MAG TPA: YncE family protein [Paludibacteraceae bacterium]|nr:YncE family protein [Paludibacteraceae bacterium]
MKFRNVFLIITITCVAFSCRKVLPPQPPVVDVVDTVSNLSKIKGVYVLNEGNMGSNSCTLDYFDYTSGEYMCNIFPTRNPHVVKELGDVGNDLQIYGSKLYAVINCSHLVEVMDAVSARHIGTIEIPNGRYLTFHDGKGYVTSYSGPVSIDPSARLGYVAEFDTASLQVTREVAVGYQPEELVVVNNKLYVANSGGYRVPNYDRTVSVVDLATFIEKKIDVAINLHRLRKDAYGRIYVTSRGDFQGTGANTYVIDAVTDSVIDTLNFVATNLTVTGDSLYFISAEWSNMSANSFSYGVYDIKQQRQVVTNFITDGTEKQITRPYGIAVNPENGDIFVTDAQNYLMPGTLYCFTPHGKLKWHAITGDIPAHFAFLNK